MLRRWLRPGSGCLRHHTRRLEARQSSCNWLRRKRLSWKNFATNDNSSPHLNLSEPSIKPPKNLAHHVHFRNEEVASSGLYVFARGIHQWATPDAETKHHANNLTIVKPMWPFFAAGT